MASSDPEAPTSPTMATKAPLERQHSDIGVEPADSKVGKVVDKFVHHIVHRPCTVAMITLFISILLSIVVTAEVLGSDEDFFSSQEPPDVGHVTSINYDTYELLIKDTEKKEEEDVDEVVPQQSQNSDVVFFVFEAKGDADTVFTEANLKSMKKIHDKVVDNKDYEKFCLKSQGAPGSAVVSNCSQPLSPVTLFYPSIEITDSIIDYSAFDVADFDKIVRVVEAVVPTLIPPSPPAAKVAVAAHTTMNGVPQASIDKVVDLWFDIVGNVLPNMDGKGKELANVPNTLKLCQHLMRVPSGIARVSYYFGKDFATTGKSRFSRGIYAFGLPLKGYKNRNDDTPAQKKLFSDWFQDNFRSFLIEAAEDDNMDVLYFATPLLEAEFLLIILVDMSLAVGSMIVVFGWLWFQTGSVTVAIAAIVEILLSLPLALFFYRLVFQIKYTAGLVAMCLYIVLAIGADDVFVFMDAYKQSLYQGPRVIRDFHTRMLWTYRRAAGAMLITSFTTMCAFVATSLSPLASVASFGIFAALCILMDYVLVITWLPAIVVWWHNTWERKPNCCCPCCWKPPEGASSCGTGCSALCKPMGDTATDVALAASSQGGIQLTVTRRLGSDEGASAQSDAEPSTAPPDNVAEPASSGVKKRWLEHFFEDKVAEFVIKYRLYVLAFFGLLCIPIIILDTQASEATSPDQFFPEDHPFQRIFTALNDEFAASAEDRKTPVFFVWGSNGLDRSGVVPLLDPAFKGEVQYDSSFEFSSEVQTYLLESCDLMRTKDFIAQDPDDPSFHEVKCFIKDFKAYREGRGEAFPAPTADAAASLVAFLDTDIPNARPGFTYFAKWEGHVGLTEAKTVAFVAIEATSTLRIRGFDTRGQLSAQYDKYEALKDELNKGAPAAAGTCFQTTTSNPGRWVWMHTQSVFITSAITGGSFGAVLAFCVLLAATRNPLVAGLSMLTIIGILGTVLAIMVIMGWEVGNIVSINLTILGGFSVDYVVHLAHSYMHSTEKKRENRVRNAFSDMGVTVLSGMITSVGAALMLFGTTLQFFAKFGGFLCMTVACSWVWANFFFMAIMATIGPERK